MIPFIHEDTALENAVPIPGILISGSSKQDFGYRVKRSKGTKDFYLTYTSFGHGIFHNGKEACSSLEGDITMITPTTPHHYATAKDANWEFYWCHFVPREDWTFLLQWPELIRGIKGIHIPSNPIRSRLIGAFSALLQYNAESGTHSERLSINTLEEVLLLISQCCAAKSQNLDTRVEEVIRLLSQDFRNPFTVSELAATVNLSPSRFAHLFKGQTGESIIEMLKKIRLRYAQKLIKSTGLSITEISAEAGFSNPNYFTQQFTAFYGCPPAKYRKQSLQA